MDWPVGIWTDAALSIAVADLTVFKLDYNKPNEHDNSLWSCRKSMTILFPPSDSIELSRYFDFHSSLSASIPLVCNETPINVEERRPQKLQPARISSEPSSSLSVAQCVHLRFRSIPLSSVWSHKLAFLWGLSKHVEISIEFELRSRDSEYWELYFIHLSRSHSLSLSMAIINSTFIGIETAVVAVVSWPRFPVTR